MLDRALDDGSADDVATLAQQVGQDAFMVALYNSKSYGCVLLHSKCVRHPPLKQQLRLLCVSLVQVERQLLDRFGGVAPGPSFFYSLRPPSTSQDEQFEMYQIFDDMVEVADDGEVGVGSGRHGNKQ